MFEKMLQDIYDMMENIEREYRRMLREDIRVPTMDMYEVDGEIVIKAEMPGVKKENITVELGKNFLEIRAKMEKDQEEREKNYYRKERIVTQYYRKIDLPFSPDPKNVRAKYENGVLEIRIKKEPAERVRVNIE